MPAFGKYGKTGKPAPSGNPLDWVRVEHRPTGCSALVHKDRIGAECKLLGWSLVNCTIIPRS